MYQFFTRLMFILAFFIGFNLPAIAAAPPASDPVRIGIMAFNEPDEVMANWHPTADWLSQQLHRPVHLTPLTPSQLDEALAKQSIDFLIGNALTTVAFHRHAN